MHRIAPIIGQALAALFVLALALPAQADQLLQNFANGSAENPAVAYNSVNDQFMVVYATSLGFMQGQIRASHGGLVRADLRGLRNLNNRSFATPRVTHRPAENRYFITAVETIPGDTMSRIVVIVLDATGALLWYRVLPDQVTTQAPTTPDIVSDPFPKCCVYVTWMEANGSIIARQLDDQGLTRGNRIEIHRPAGSPVQQAYNPRLAYQQAPYDQFTVVYQVARGGQNGQIRARSLAALSASLGPARTLATMQAAPRISFGERFRGAPDVAYDESSQLYFVAWRDERSLRLVRSNPNLQLPRTVQVYADNPQTGHVLADGSPEVMVADGFGKVLVSHPIRMQPFAGPWGSTSVVQGWWFSATGNLGTHPLSSGWSLAPTHNVVAAFSPLRQRAFGVWERSAFTASGMDKRDLYYSTRTVP